MEENHISDHNLDEIEEEMNNCKQKLNQLKKEKEKLIYENKEIIYIAEHYITKDYQKFLKYCMSNKIKKGYKSFLDNNYVHEINFF